MKEDRKVEYFESDLVDVDPVPNLNIPELITTACKRPKHSSHEYLVCYSEPAKAYEGGCLNYGSISFVRHGYAEEGRVIHDVNIGLCRVDIILKVPRYRCNDCGGTFRHPFEEIPERLHVTRRLLEQIRRDALVRPFSKVADEFGYTEGPIRSIFNDFIATLDTRRGPIYAPEVLGIDEKHIAHKMRGVFIDVERGILLEMTPENKRDNIIGMIEKLQEPENIRIVTMDMANGYRSYIQECLPNAKIIVDKFHIYQALYKKVKTVKSQIMVLIGQQIESETDPQATQEKTTVRNALARNSYLFKFSKEKIENDERLLSLMTEVCDTFPEFNHLRLLKDGFTRIYEDAHDRATAEQLYMEWEQLVPPRAAKEAAVWEEKYGVPAKLFEDFRSFQTTIKNWWQEVFGYFDPGCSVTNAATEGINRFIQSIDEPGSGYGFDHLRGKCVYGQKYGQRIVFNIKKSKEPIYATGCAISAGLRVVGYETVAEVVASEEPVHFLNNSGFDDRYYDFGDDEET